VPFWSYIIVAVAAYLLGSIPTGFLVAKGRGVDLQKSGSGNIGATNAMRVLGKPMGIFVLLMDVLKGFAAVWLCNFLLQIFNAPAAGLENYRIVAGIFAVLGHNYPCWLKFKGGKGVATTTGVYLALAPEALAVALAVFVLALLLTKYVSVGSILAAVALPAAVWFTKEDFFLRMVTIALGIMAILKHRKNIQRLMAGTESRLGEKSQPVEVAK